MLLRSILSAMRRNKAGAILIALQMALTQAVLCNALFVIYQRVHNSNRPSGIDESNIFVVFNVWMGNPPDTKPLQLADLATLRQLPGVVDAFATNSYPLRGAIWETNVRLVPEQTRGGAHAAVYFVDEHAQNALGVRLTAGRWFYASEVIDRNMIDRKPTPGAIIVTRPLAEKLFPERTALGKTVYIEGASQTIVGIIERMQAQVPSTGTAQGYIEDSVLRPGSLIARTSRYIVRTHPGKIDSVAVAAQGALLTLNRARVIRYVRTFSEVRDLAYGDDRAFAFILASLCAILVAVTAFGIVGLTSFWVTQRTRQIGLRRALGATRRAILHHFQVENLVIAIPAAAVGVALAIALNLWMVSSFEMSRIPVLPVIAAAVLIPALGQVAVLWPALRASLIPPALATRVN